MSASMNDIKNLRNKTGAGFADCKKALDQSGGDMAQAEKLLKEMGLAAATKRVGRQTGEGSIFTDANEKGGAILELRCETDFVARNDEFQALGHSLLADILNSPSAPSQEAMQEKVTALIGTIKENMDIKRFELLQKKNNEIVACYTHGKPGRLGAVVLVSAQTLAPHEERLRAFAHHCALHAVARVPLYLSPETVDAAYKNMQMEIFTAQVAQMGKPAEVAKGIIEGKWKKHLDEICFLLQPWVHDEKSTPQKEIEKLSKELGTPVSISNYRVYILGDE